MAVHVLRCPNCGADLDVVDGVETIRCKFCGARCQIEGQGAHQHLTLIAEQLGRIEQHAARTSAEVEAMRQQHAYGLASQYQTDEALRRAAAAQEVAAHESAYAARMQSATYEAVSRAGQQWAAGQEAERLAVVKLRTSYRWAKAFFWLTLVLPPLLALPYLSTSGTTSERVAGTAGLAFGLFVLASPLWLIGYYVARRSGRKFNERAFLYGLPEVRVKSKAEEDWERQSKKLWGSKEKSSVGGCLGLVVLLGIGVAVCSTKDKNRDNKPAHTRECASPDANSVPSVNSPPPASPDNLEGASNQTDESASAPEGEAD